MVLSWEIVDELSASTIEHVSECLDVASQDDNAARSNARSWLPSRAQQTQVESLNRDEFVEIHPSYASNYAKLTESNWVNTSSPYDFDSIMHYPTLFAGNVDGS